MPNENALPSICQIVPRKAKSQKNWEALPSRHLSNIWFSISSHACQCCSSALKNLLRIDDPWSRELERKHTQNHQHDQGWLHNCRCLCKSITACTVLCARTGTKKTTIQSTPPSVAHRSNRTNTSLHPVQSAAFAICHSVIQLFAQREQSYKSCWSRQAHVDFKYIEKRLLKSTWHSYSPVKWYRTNHVHHEEFCQKIIPAIPNESFVECRQNPIVIGGISL